MEVDVSTWSVIRLEPGGRDAFKVWVASDSDAPRDEHWLWKLRQVTADGSVQALTDCAEVIVSRIAAQMGLPAAECRYARTSGALGVISRNVTPPGFNLNAGATYLSEVEGYVLRDVTADETGRVRGLVRRDEGYTLDAVQEVLAGVPAPPQGPADMTAFDVFAGYLVLDALVANTDRHPRNWAILERQSDGQRFLAPTFDHGSALGAGLTDGIRATRSPAAFAARGKANAFWPRGQSLVGLALEAVRRSGTDHWLRRVADLRGEDLRATMEAPPDRLSVVASTFIEQVVLRNQGRLCDGYAAED